MTAKGGKAKPSICSCDLSLPKFIRTKSIVITFCDDLDTTRFIIDVGGVDSVPAAVLLGSSDCQWARHGSGRDFGSFQGTPRAILRTRGG